MERPTSSGTLLLVAAAAIVMVGLVAVVVVAAGPGAPSSVPAATPPAAAPVAASDPSARRPRAEVDVLAARASAMSRREPRHEASAGDGEIDADPAARAAASDERARRRMALFADAFAAEATDAAWSPGAERGIRDGFVARVPVEGAALDEVGCRASLCRIAVRFPSANARQLNGDRVTAAIPWQTTGIIHNDPADPARLIVYAVREGQRPPHE